MPSVLFMVKLFKLRLWITLTVLLSLVVASPILAREYPKAMLEAKLGIPLADFLKLDSSEGFNRKDGFGGGQLWIPRIELSRGFPEYDILSLTLFFGAEGKQPMYMARAKYENAEQALEAANETFGKRNDGLQWKKQFSGNREINGWVSGPYFVVVATIRGTEKSPWGPQTRPKSTDLEKACRDGDLTKVVEILKNFPETIDQKSELSTPLHEASQAGFSVDFEIPGERPYTEIVKYLLAKGADPNEKAALGLTPLHETIYCAPRELIEALLAAGADPTIKDSDGFTPWDGTYGVNLSEERKNMLRELLTNPNRDFFEAVKYATPGQVKEALRREPNLLQSRNSEGMTGLHIASSCGSPEKLSGVLESTSVRYLKVVDLLLESGMDPNLKGGKEQSTALHFACKRGSVSITERLLAAGADPNAKDSKGRRPSDMVGRNVIKQATADRLWQLLGRKGKAPTNLLSEEQKYSLCVAELKNLATGLEMYKIDHEESEPSNLEALVPIYLKRIPPCYLSPDASYQMKKTPQGYQIWCKDKNGQPVGPHYDENLGLVEK